MKFNYFLILFLFSLTIWNCQSATNSDFEKKKELAQIIEEQIERKTIDNEVKIDFVKTEEVTKISCKRS
jgi:predicted kinase